MHRLTLTGVALAGLTVLWAAAVEAADYMPLKIGTEWTMKRVGADGKEAQDTWKVTKEDAYGGKSFFVVARQDGREIWQRKETRAQVYVMEGGKTVDTFNPDWGDWQWPLAVGKTWNTTYSLLSGGRTISAAGSWTVAGEEEITVPAGKFKTLRIERAPGNNSNHVVKRWYAPEIGLVVKQIDSRSGQPGEQVQELVSYKLP